MKIKVNYIDSHYKFKFTKVNGEGGTKCTIGKNI